MCEGFKPNSSLTVTATAGGDGIRIAGRNTQGVTIFRTREDEHVVSVGRIEDVEGDEEEGDEE